MQINNQFIKEHDRLVRVIVNQYHVSGVDPEDLMQEGRIGLIEAAKPTHSSGCILVPDRELEDQLVERQRGGEAERRRGGKAERRKGREAERQKGGKAERRRGREAERRKGGKAERLKGGKAERQRGGGV